MPLRYVRFELSVHCRASDQRIGVFQFGRALHRRRRRAVPDHRIERHFRWFNDYLVAPHFEVTDRRATFWFRHDAGEALRRARALVSFLRRRGVVVHTRQTDDPGDIVYRDSHQVAAVPRDAAARRR
jgi:hypothetical protein